MLRPMQFPSRGVCLINDTKKRNKRLLFLLFNPLFTAFYFPFTFTNTRTRSHTESHIHFSMSDQRKFGIDRGIFSFDSLSTVHSQFKDTRQLRLGRKQTTH